jgi:hypothetical protein
VVPQGRAGPDVGDVHHRGSAGSALEVDDRRGGLAGVADDDRDLQADRRARAARAVFGDDQAAAGDRLALDLGGDHQEGARLFLEAGRLREGRRGEERAEQEGHAEGEPRSNPRSHDHADEPPGRSVSGWRDDVVASGQGCIGRWRAGRSRRGTGRTASYGIHGGPLPPGRSTVDGRRPGRHERRAGTPDPAARRRTAPREVPRAHPLPPHRRLAARPHGATCSEAPYAGLVRGSCGCRGMGGSPQPDATNDARAPVGVPWRRAYEGGSGGDGYGVTVTLRLPVVVMVVTSLAVAVMVVVPAAMGSSWMP